MARWSKLGIIAGGGDLPARIISACDARNDPWHLIKINGAADDALASRAGEECGIGEAGKILRLLKENDCDAVVFAGNVRRPDFSSVKVDWRGAALLPKVIAAAARGDGHLLSVLVDTVEAEGLRVVGAEDVFGDLLSQPGVLGSVTPNDEARADIAKAASLISALGPFDVGQASIVARGFVLAIEAAEGTDVMLERCAAPSLTAGREHVGVLVKRPKPDQELRIDLPVIGPETVRRAAAAKLAGIAVEAGKALIIDRDALIAEANELGLFVYGFTAPELDTFGDGAQGAP